MRYNLAMLEKNVLIDPRFKGPPDSANGGYTAGLIAREFEGAVTVTLRSPPPLGTSMELQHDSEKATLTHGEQLVATAHSDTLKVALPEIPAKADIESCVHTYVSAEEHVLSTCFVCGPARARGDGLNIFPVVVPGYECVASNWVPVENLADNDGLIASEIMWAALDCPGYFAHQQLNKTMLLGRMTGEVFQRPKVGQMLRSIGWPTRVDGRKHFSATAIVDEGGRVLAASQQIWIALN